MHDGEKDAANAIASFFSIVCVLYWYSANQVHSIAHLKFSIKVAAVRSGNFLLGIKKHGFSVV